MAKRCDVCGKGKMTGHNVSHAVNRTKRKFKPNIQRISVQQGDRTTKMNVCTRCLRSGKVKKAL